jgi:hypothetical protein
LTLGIKSKDALHVATAMTGKAEYLPTTITDTELKRRGIEVLIAALGEIQPELAVIHRP